MPCFRQFALVATSYTALAVAIGWRLHANDAPQAKEADHGLSEIAACIHDVPAEVRPEAMCQLALLTNAEVRALQGWLKADSEQRLRRLTVLSGPIHAPSALNTALLFSEIDRADAVPADEAWLFVSAAGERLEEAHKIAALERIAARAAGEGRLDLALEIHQRVCEFPTAGWEKVLALVDASHAARRPAAALRVVQKRLAAAPVNPVPAWHEEAMDLQITLLLEGGRYAEAARFALDDLRSLKPGDAVPMRLLQRAVLATRASGASAEMLPWIERHLRSYPEHQLALTDIAGGKPLSATYRHWLRESASIADRNHQGSIACDGYLRLAAAGETHVLARLQVLAAQTGRSSELQQIVASLKQKLSVLEISQALAAGGATAQAREMLAASLANEPDHRAGWRLLTKFDVTLRGDASAGVLWMEFLKRFPDDVPALIELARLQSADAQPMQALRTLSRIPDAEFDEGTLRQMFALAEKVGDFSAAHRALRLLVQGQASPSFADIMALSALNMQQADDASAKVLTEVLAKLPAGSAMRKMAALPPIAVEAAVFSTAVEAK